MRATPPPWGRAAGCDAPEPSVYQMYDGSWSCRCMVCARCGHHTGNNTQGHYWRFCKVTGQMEEFHLCCPGDCELREGTDAGADPGQQGIAERCHRPGCEGQVTGSSDYCSRTCEDLAAKEKSLRDGIAATLAAPVPGKPDAPIVRIWGRHSTDETAGHWVNSWAGSPDDVAELVLTTPELRTLLERAALADLYADTIRKLFAALGGTR